MARQGSSTSGDLYADLHFVKDLPTQRILLRLLDEVATLRAAASQAATLSLPQVQAALQRGGSAELNVSGLVGVLLNEQFGQGWRDDGSYIFETVGRNLKLLTSPFGGNLRLERVQEELTLTGTTTNTLGSLKPANSLLLAGNVVVLTTITRAVANPTTLSLGDGGAAGRFATGVGVTVGSSKVGLRQWRGVVAADVDGPYEAAGGVMTVTIDGAGALTAGRVRVELFYLVGTAPTT